MVQAEYMEQSLSVLGGGQIMNLDEILRKHLDKEYSLVCPDCGCREIESNNLTEYRCVECDHRWGFDNGEPYGF
jgi:tRNA(Ile2) C34 agmatinyltransferase TiaS